MTEDKAISSAVVVMNISALQDLEKVVNFMCIPAHAAAQGVQSDVTSVFIRRLQIWPSIPETVFIFNSSRLNLNIEMRGIIYKYHKLVVIPSCTWICVCVYVHMWVRTCVCVCMYMNGVHIWTIYAPAFVEQNQCCLNFNSWLLYFTIIFWGIFSYFSKHSPLISNFLPA